jgi:NDP-sugar pyrophosphorylase family protein
VNAHGLIMAGGRSKRMRATGGKTHKALVRVLGMTMLERNMRYLIDSGFYNFTVAVSAREAELVAYLRNEGVDVAASLGGRCEIFVEREPLGNIGAVREIPFTETLLVAYVDNLTTLPLAEMTERHHAIEADLTIAAHREALPLDFGELVLEGAAVVEYREKPVRYPIVSSGTYVVSRRAADCIAPGEQLNIAEFFTRVRERGYAIAAFVHDAAWVDVNDWEAVARAESMLKAVQTLR